MSMRFLSWNDFRSGVHKLGEFAIEHKVKAVAGVPRGGLVVAVALSHEIGVPLMPFLAIKGQKAPDDHLLVDDIADTGTRLKACQNHYSMTAVWFKRWSCKTQTWAVVIEHSDAWLVFPWENHGKAKADYEAYRARMANASVE